MENNLSKKTYFMKNNVLRSLFKNNLLYAKQFIFKNNLFKIAYFKTTYYKEKWLLLFHCYFN